MQRAQTVKFGCASLAAILASTLLACSGASTAETPESQTSTVEPEDAAAEGSSTDDPSEPVPGGAAGDAATQADAPTTDSGPAPAPAADAADDPDVAAPPAPPPSDAATTPPPAQDAAPPPLPPPQCGEAPAEPASPPVTPPATKYPEIKHWELPAANVVALTFDDGPAPATTNRILDILAAEKVRATFFINSRSAIDLRTNAAAQATVRRIVAEGHVLGNHTASHYDLRTASVDVEEQLALVESDVRLVAPCAPPLTLIRTPFGQPQLAGTEEDRLRVLPILARHGVHIGWTIESLDYECNELGPACVVERVKKRLALGKRGSILMHDTQPVTVEALPLVIAEIRARGLGFVTAEKLVRDKYGKTSAELVVK